MEFVQLTRFVLLTLRSRGYNVLTSVNGVSDADPTWMPEKIYDVEQFLSGLDHTPFGEQAVLVVDDVLANIPDEQLIGMVWIE